MAVFVKSPCSTLHQLRARRNIWRVAVGLEFVTRDWHETERSPETSLSPSKGKSTPTASAGSHVETNQSDIAVS